MKKVMFIKGLSQYDALRVFTDTLVKEFNKRGIGTVILDLTASVDEVKEILTDCVNGNIDAVFSFNGVGCNMEVNGKYLAAYTHTPHCVWLVDHPMRHVQRLRCPIETGLNVITVDEDHQQYVDRYIKNVSKTCMIGHGGIKSDKDIPYHERTIDVLFPGSYYSPEGALKDLGDDEQSDMLKPLIFGIIDLMKCNPALCEEDAIRQYFLEYRLNDMMNLIPDIMENIILIDNYIRAFRRHEVIRTLVESGIKVHVYGAGWENFQCENRENLTVGHSLNFCETLDIMADSKIVLNVMPEFKRGTHERVVCAMLNGAVALTDTSSVYMQEFTNGEEIVFYDITKLELLPDIVNNILSDNSAAEKIAANGQQKALLRHQWSSRAETLIEIMGLETA